MSIKKTWGSAPAAVPEGFTRRIRFEPLAWVDQETPDGRILTRAGMQDPYLPMTIKFNRQGEHGGAFGAGRIDEVTLHEDGRITAVGFIEDSPYGADLETAAKNRVIKGNSIELRDTQYSIKFPTLEEWLNIEEDAEGFEGPMPRVKVRFDQWSMDATAVVISPAFGHAAVFLDDGEDLVASFGAFDVLAPHEREVEMVASGSPTTDVYKPSWADFHIEEPDHPQKIIVETPEEGGRVYGHLGLFGTCHTGFINKCEMIPRSANSYANYCTPGVLTDQGWVSTGVIALYGGHPHGPLDPRKVDEAYGSVENAWADVRIVDGKFGPWLSGRIRPNRTADDVYAARASKISGHWKGGDLKAIVSVNFPGYDVPDMSYSDLDGELDLVASFSVGCGDTGDESDDDLVAALGALASDELDADLAELAAD